MITKTPNESPFCLTLLCLVSKGFTPASLCNDYERGLVSSVRVCCCCLVVLVQSLPFQSFKVNWREWVECSANRLSLSSRWKMTSTCRPPQLLWVCVCPLSVLRCEAFPYVNSFYFFPSPNNPLTNPVIHSSMHFLLITDCLWFEVNLFSQYPGFHCWCALLLWLKKKITKF